ncbi:MAG: hypothetical protein CR991_06415 [Proteobacteria bacterium]|nr:MAG: hypothetical protein CR991_06415 [Pseudomonadota bacterium]
MEYILVAVFAIGLLLFVLSWLRVIWVGFKHHPMTGLISAIPVVNLLVLPTIWHKVSGWLLLGFIGLLITIMAWFMGAEQRVYRYNLGGTEATTEASSADESSKIDLPLLGGDDDSSLSSGQELPKAALYRMVYKPVTVNELNNYINEYVRISRQDRSQPEGKLLRFADKYLIIERRINEHLDEVRINLDDITQAEVITRE